MGIFSGILSKLGFSSDAVATAESAPAPAPAPAGTPPAAAVAAVPAPVAVSDVDVVSKLTGLADASDQDLNWQTSIVDLLKLLSMDSSLDARKKLAAELGAPAELEAGSAEFNEWLHKATLAKLAANGGNVPANLLG